MLKKKSASRISTYVSVCIHIEKGCNVEEGEYSLHLSGMTRPLDIRDNNGTSDIDLIKDCVVNHLGEYELPTEGAVEFVLKESGEREDVFWNKYYVIEEFRVIADYSDTPSLFDTIEPA